MPSPILHAEVTPHGKIVWPSAEAAKRLTVMHALRGQRIEVILRAERTQRSLDQNAFIHAVVFPLVSQFTGYTVPETKLVLMGECFGWQRLAGHECPVKPSTAQMTTAECAHFIDWVIPWAVEHCDGLQIPLPNEVEP